MAYHFSANQFEDRYRSNRLQNWELPKHYPPRPRPRKGSSKFISDNRGHLLPDVTRTNSSPFSNFRSTYQLPDKLTRKFAKEYDDCLQQRHKYASFNRQTSAGGCGKKYFVRPFEDIKPPNCPTTCETLERVLSADKGRHVKVHPCENRKEKKASTALERLQSDDKVRQMIVEPCGAKKNPNLDLEYVPGDFTPPALQHETRNFLLDSKLQRDNEADLDYNLKSKYNYNPEDIEATLNKYKAPENSTHFSPPYPLTASLTAPLVAPPPERFGYGVEPEDDTLDFDTTTKEPTMYNQGVITGKPHERCPSPVVPAFANFELAKRMHQENLDHQPLPDCVADLAYRKLQISGGQPGLALEMEPIASGVGVKMHNAGPTHCTKVRVFRPKTCGVVPKPLKGSTPNYYNGMTTDNRGKDMTAMDLAIGWDYKPPNPADEPQPPRHIDGSNDSVGPAVFTYVKTPRDDPMPSAGRSAGVFQSTLGEADFFDKDIMRRKTDFMGRNIEHDDFCGGCLEPPVTRARSVTRDYGGIGDVPTTMPNRLEKQYQSTPNILHDPEYKAIREKYLRTEMKKGASALACRRSNPGFFQRARNRLCHKVGPQPFSGCCHPLPERRPACKAAFRVGVPKYDASGYFISSDSGCSTGSHHCPRNPRVLVVPRPRNPYVPKNYNIDTLVPPFMAINGGAAQGGYPEHWRLASVYQHAYKPLEQRRRPLLATVYK